MIPRPRIVQAVAVAETAGSMGRGKGTEVRRELDGGAPGEGRECAGGGTGVGRGRAEIPPHEGDAGNVTLFPEF